MMPHLGFVKIEKAIGWLAVFVYLTAVVFVAVFGSAIGFSRIAVFRSKATESRNEDPGRAFRFLTDPEALSLEGSALLEANRPREAAQSFRKALSIKPHDYFLWIKLGDSCENFGDFEQARNAYEKALELAPHYIRPRWRLGELYSLQNKPEQAFVYYNEAADIDPGLLREVIILASKTFSGDPARIEQLVRSDSTDAKKELALFFLENDLMTDQVAKFLTGGELDADSKDRFIKKLIGKRKYALAYSIWLSKSGTESLDASPNNPIVNGGFENEIEDKEVIFGWKTEKTEKLFLSRESSRPFSGKANLVIRFEGKSNPNSAIITQMIPVESNENYQLTFAAQAHDLVTGGLPYILIVDEVSGDIIGRSPPLPADSGFWQIFKLDFRTTARTEAIRVIVKRDNCFSGNCPIFGTLSLDGFNLKKSN